MAAAVALQKWSPTSACGDAADQAIMRGMASRPVQRRAAGELAASVK